MKKYYNDKEYMDIISNILNNNDFKKLETYKHHGDNRMDHCIRVSYYSYLIAKKSNLHYKDVARAGLLHDFFFVNNQELDFVTRTKVLFNHPKIALKNAMNYYELTKLEQNIIESHMFPIGLTLPRYKESWLVNLVDDYFSIYERVISITKSIKEFISKSRIKKRVYAFLNK